MEAKLDQKEEEKMVPDVHNADSYPSVILVIIHGLKNQTKHEQLTKAAKALGINIIIPSKDEDTNDLDDKQRVELYKKMVIEHKPDMIIGQSSGGNVISSLVVDENVWYGPTWIISARLVEKIYKSKHKDMPILFSHGTKDNLSYMNGLCKNKFSRCKLIEFEGDHYAQNLFVNDDAIKNIKELIKICYALQFEKPKKLGNKLSLSEMMKQKFAEK
eukprot:539530_1